MLTLVLTDTTQRNFFFTQRSRTVVSVSSAKERRKEITVERSRTRAPEVGSRLGTCEPARSPHTCDRQE